MPNQLTEIKRRSEAAHNIETGAGLTAGAIGSAFGLARLRDAYKKDYPESYERARVAVAAKHPRLAQKLTSHPGFKSTAAIGVAGLTAAGAHRYQQLNELREKKIKRARAARKRETMAKARRVATHYEGGNRRIEQWGPRTYDEALEAELSTYNPKSLTRSAAPMYGHTPAGVRSSRRQDSMLQRFKEWRAYRQAGRTRRPGVAMIPVSERKWPTEHWREEAAARDKAARAAKVEVGRQHQINLRRQLQSRREYALAKAVKEDEMTISAFGVDHGIVSKAFPWQRNRREEGRFASYQDHVHTPRPETNSLNRRGVYDPERNRAIRTGAEATGLAGAAGYVGYKGVKQRSDAYKALGQSVGSSEAIKARKEVGAHLEGYVANIHDRAHQAGRKRNMPQMQETIGAYNAEGEAWKKAAKAHEAHMLGASKQLRRAHGKIGAAALLGAGAIGVHQYGNRGGQPYSYR